MKADVWGTEQEKMQQFEKCAGDVMPQSIVRWLRDIGYFTAPAGKIHHGSILGGLFEHSYQVAFELSKMTNLLNLEWERPESPLIVGLLHDVCKTEEYSLILDEEEEKGYRIEWNKRQIITGHGTASVMMVQQYAIESGEFTLTKEELMCIKFHMGAFTDRSEWEFYGRAVERYPNVLYTHTADMIASRIKGK